MPEIVASKELPVLKHIVPKFELQTSGPISRNCRLQAKNDWEAICDWLAEHSTSSGTERIYRREATRFFLWCRYKKGVMFTRLTKDDINAYLKFLKSPDKSWCATRKALRNGQWRPFVGPLGLAAYTTAVQVINSLLQYLTDAHYIEFNPLKLVNPKKTLTINPERQKYKVWERILEDELWQALQHTLKNLPANNKDELHNKERAKFLFALLYLLGLRISEVTSSTWSAFRQRHNQWWFFVEGKGGKLGHIPVNNQLLTAVKRYRLHLGKPILPTPEETEHLLVSRKTKQPLGVRQLRDVVKAIGKQAALQFIDEPVKKQKLEKFSPHWLRHLSASHQDRAGVPATIIKANHRHSSLQTTQIYMHADDTDRFTQMQKITMDVLPVQPATENNSKLQIIIKTKPMNSLLHFEKLIVAIEIQTLKKFAWKRAGDMDNGDFSYEAYNRRSRPIVITYQFAMPVSIDVLEQLKQDISKEADIRYFGCEVVVGQTS